MQILQSTVSSFYIAQFCVSIFRWGVQRILTILTIHFLRVANASNSQMSSKPLCICKSNVESVVCCTTTCSCGHWVYGRLSRHGSNDSKPWPAATATNIQDILHYCNLVRGTYAKEPEGICKRTNYVTLDLIRKLVTVNLGTCPPHYIITDPHRREVVLCIRGLHLAQSVNYITLAHTRKGSQKYDGGYVHKGLFSAAEWLMQNEVEFLREELVDNPGFRLTIVGHSLGAGVAAMFTIIIVNQLYLLGDLPRDRLSCYGIAPSRSMSLNLGLQYADVINSVVLQVLCS